jgi:hypothetical protein
VPVSPTLAEAWERAAPQGIDLILSGHVHLFELFSYDHGRPTQLVAGDGGTNLAMALVGSMPRSAGPGVSVLARESQRQFGYTVFTRHGKTWNLKLKNRVRNVLVNCEIASGRASCQTPPAP